jgi:hypothetical protein
MTVSRVAVGLALVLAGCSAEGTKSVQTVPDCSLPTPLMTPPYATLHLGDTLRARASFVPCPQENGIVVAFRWRSSDTTIATVDSIAGLVRARKTGTATIIATLTANTAEQSAMALNVVP